MTQPPISNNTHPLPMTATPPFTEASLRRNATDQSWARGQDYYRGGAVTQIVRRPIPTGGDRITATVEGSEANDYRVLLTCDRGGLTSATCSCPYDYEGWCKHIIAVGLTCIHKPDQIRIAPSLETLLAPLSRDDLSDIILELIESDSELAETVEELALDLADLQTVLEEPPAIAAPPSAPSYPTPEPATTPATKTAPSKSSRQTPLDLARYRKQAKAAIRSLARDLEEAYDYYDLHDNSELDTLLQVPQGFLDKGDANNALLILEAITTTLADEWDAVSDYGLEGEEVIPLLDQLWATAILGAEATVLQSLDLANQFDTWGTSLGRQFTIAPEALAQGWDDPDLTAVLAGDRPSPVESPESSESTKSLAVIRLEILANQERWDEYLNLARAEAEEYAYVSALLNLGRSPEATATIPTLQNFRTVYPIAEAFREHGALAEALQVVQRGMAIADQAQAERSVDSEVTLDSAYSLSNDRLRVVVDLRNLREGRGYELHKLAIWGAELAEGLGEIATAIALRVRAFKAQPQMVEYQILKQQAGSQWQTVQPELLKSLRSGSSWDNRTIKVDIFLSEGLVADAIKVVKNDLHGDDFLKVLRAAVSVEPDWVINAGKQGAEKIVDAKKADRYDWAVNYLVQVRAAYEHLDRKTDWRTYRDSLVSAHSRKPKFMGLMRDKKLL